MVTDHEDTTHRAERLVATAAAKRRRADRDLRNALRLARDEGVSLQALADAAGIPHTTIADDVRQPVAGEEA